MTYSFTLHDGRTITKTLKRAAAPAFAVCVTDDKGAGYASVASTRALADAAARRFTHPSWGYSKVTVEPVTVEV